MLATAAYGQLAFETENIVHDVGLLDEKTEGIFRFTNSGQEEITITDVSSSCGCTVPKLDKRTYKPGESGEIRALFTFGARVGSQSKRITVRTNGAGNIVHALTMVTNIPEWVVIEPRILRWRVGEAGTPQQVRIRVADPAKIKMETPDAVLESFSADLDEVAPGQYVLTISPKSMESRATEFVRLAATVTDGGVSRTRQFGMHCLIR